MKSGVAVQRFLLCLWVMVHLNIPASHEGFWCAFARKLRRFVSGGIVPEFLILASSIRSTGTATFSALALTNTHYICYQHNLALWDPLATLKVASVYRLNG